MVDQLLIDQLIKVLAKLLSREYKQLNETTKLRSTDEALNSSNSNINEGKIVVLDLM